MQPGDLIGHYQFERLLDQKATAEVWSARDVRQNEPVAIKWMKRAVVDRWRVKSRFYREAYAAATIRHPNIVEVHAVTEIEGCPAIVMELLDGESLRARLDRGPLELHEAAHVVSRVAVGLMAAHAQGIVHRDLKPANIFLEHSSGAAVPKVLDFGLARLASSAKISNVFLGTPYYMSPEQLRELDVDDRSDVWSLGIVLYECLTGETPTAAATWPEMVMKIFAGVAPIRRALPDLPRGLASLIGRMLELDRDARASLEEVELELSSYVRRQSGFLDCARPASKPLAARDDDR